MEEGVCEVIAVGGEFETPAVEGEVECPGVVVVVDEGYWAVVARPGVVSEIFDFDELRGGECIEKRFVGIGD